MNANNFSEYIKNPSQLYQISYQELKSLTLQYPYCQNLRYLLLQKSKLENHKDFDRNLEMAATYSTDRPFLYKLLKEIATEIEQEESYLMSDEILELKDLHSLEEIVVENTGQLEGVKIEELLFSPDEFEEEIIPIPDIPTTEEEEEDYLENLLHEETETSASVEHMVAEEIDFTKTVDELIETTLADEDEVSPEHTDIQIEESIEDVIEHIQEEPSIIEDSLVADMVGHSLIIENLLDDFDQEETPTFSSLNIPLEITNMEAQEEEDFSIPEPKTSFNSWLKQFESPVIEQRFEELLEISKKAKEKRKDKIKAINELEAKVDNQSNEVEPAKKPKELAKDSIQEDNEIISETLAQLLERQGHVQRAIDMYERLGLQNPEKSSSFAAKIEELKKSL